MEYKLDLLKCVKSRLEQLQTQKLKQNEVLKAAATFLQKRAQSGEDDETKTHPADLIAFLHSVKIRLSFMCSLCDMICCSCSVHSVCSPIININFSPTFNILTCHNGIFERTIMISSEVYSLKVSITSTFRSVVS